jgi:hypothetical protein
LILTRATWRNIPEDGILQTDGQSEFTDWINSTENVQVS